MRLDDYKQKISQFKETNKQLVSDIKYINKKWKEFNKVTPFVPWCWKSDPDYKKYQEYCKKVSEFGKTLEDKRNSSSDERRYYHVAYSLLRGRKYKQIENKVKEGNGLPLDYVERKAREFFPEITMRWADDDLTEVIIGVKDEDVCAS